MTRPSSVVESIFCLYFLLLAAFTTGSSCATAASLVDFQTAATTSFEDCKPGTFEKLVTEIGTWTPISGAAIIDGSHARSGANCLQLTGGSDTCVQLEIRDETQVPKILTFWAERWTKRDPFTFRIEGLTDSGWKEIYNGDADIRVGRAFLSQVSVPIDSKIRQLRLTATSPADTGILIDDVRLTPALPQKIVGVEAIPLTLPALVGADASPLFKLKVEVVGSINPISLSELQGTLEGTCESKDLVSVSVYFGGPEFSKAKLVRTIGNKRTDPRSFVCSSPLDSCQLADGTNFVWIVGKLRSGADVDQTVGAGCQQVTFSNGEIVKLENATSVQRMGVALRQAGDDGVHTYRIPGLATTNDGSLIGVYDVRHRSGGDLPGDIDVGMSRSTDGGQTWQPMQVIMDMGDDPDWRYDGIGDPAVLVDKNTGTIWVAATWSHGNRSWHGSGPGLTPDETGQLLLVRSDDDGVTWSKPINITAQVKRPEWCFLLQGPGKGITMSDGTIVFAAQYQDPPHPTDKQSHRLPHSTIIYSKDHGTTWQVGTGAFDDTTEAQVVEIQPGQLMLNCRYNRAAARVVMSTRDMGQSWQAHSTSQQALIEPGSCMASLIDVDREVGKAVGGWLLFSNPNSTRGRHHLTIKASRDRGLTWPEQHQVLLDEGLSAGYSCLSMIDAETVGILYEGSQAHMTFQRIPLADLVGARKVASADE